MASGTLDADKINKEKSKWEAGNKVYTRRPKKGINTTTAAASLDPPVTTASPDPPATTASPPPPATTASPAPPATTASPSPPATTASPAPPVTEGAPASPITTANDEQTLTNEDANLQREETLPQVSDDSSGQSLGHEPVPETSGPTGNGVTRPIVTFVDDRVKIYLEASTSKNEIKDLWEKLTAELHQVRNVAQKLQDKEAEITHYSTHLGITNNNEETYSQPQYPGNVTRSLVRVNSEMGPDLIDRRALMRVNSEVNPIANHEMSRFRQLSVSVGDYVEKEKRTPKANQYYRNSDFLLGKDRLPPESNKRQKSNSGRKSDYTINIERHKNQAFRSCSSLLQRLMKHKHGWVFNEPVNAKALGLHDYHDIIKHPMDLGTIKSRLAQSFYKTPGEFAEDVRLTFHNAMTYNPKGQDVHVMAEQLLNIFEERWVVIESDWRYGTVHDSVTTPTPTSRNNSQIRTFDRSQSMGVPVMSRAKPSIFVPVSRTPVPKKPKAKEPNKRDMTYEEKQKLSANLQNLPSEKLDSIVQIIKKSNTSLSQNDDEIEVDIDSVDVETLWELDRFVTNYKKNLSKHRRKAELSQQARALGGNTNGKTMLQNTATPVLEAPTKEKRADEKSPPENQGNVSSSSSSSSSDSGSSSSDSDSDSSSDAGQ